MTAITTDLIKEIRYNHGDYDMYLNGEYVGSEASYHAAEVELDRLAYEHLNRAGVEPEMLLSATVLDGVCQCGATFNEFGQCETCGPDEDDEPAEDGDDYQEGDPRDEDVYAPPFGLPAPAGKSDCLAYSTPPSLALWGPPNPLCPKCGQAHDPIVVCPSRGAVSTTPEPDAFFILPAAQAGDRDEKIIICIGGHSRWISASEVARALALAGVHS